MGKTGDDWACVIAMESLGELIDRLDEDPGSYSADGLWRARHGDGDLCAATCGGLMDECEDYLLLEHVQAGTLWDDVYVPGEPNITPLASCWRFTRRPASIRAAACRAPSRLRVPRIYRPRAELLPAP